jgi:hypothetical protein
MTRTYRKTTPEEREALDAACCKLRNGPWGLPEYGS